MTTVYLHGSLAKKYGKEPIQVDADTIAQVVRGLIFRFGDEFKQVLKAGNWHVFRGAKKKGNDIGEEELNFKLKPNENLHLEPALEGRSAAVRIVIGVALILVAVFAPVPPNLKMYLISAGASMILGGVAEMLSPKPQTGVQNQAGANPSFIFNGAVNVTEQGSAVPLVYGRVNRCSTVVISSGLTTENIAL